jgi:(S)-sulfolactate dehydrogenase
MRVVVSEFMDEPAVAALARAHDVLYEPGLVDRRVDLLARVGDAAALIVRNRTRVDAELLAAAPSLRVVGRLGVGLDNIDVDACRTRGVGVIPATGANARAVAEYVIATALTLLRGRVYASSAAVAAGEWPRQTLAGGREAGGKTLGLVGFGAIGRITGRLARALGMRTIAFDPAVAPHAPQWTTEATEPTTLHELLARADVVSLHVPLTDATRRLIDAAAIASMKRDAVLVNTSRGGVVDEAALAGALRAGSLAGAALDVFETEPLRAGSPLAGCPNLILTPHVAGVTLESNARVSSMIAERVAAALAG